MGSTRLPDDRTGSFCGAHRGSPHTWACSWVCRILSTGRESAGSRAQPETLAWPPEWVPPWGDAPAASGCQSEKCWLLHFRPPMPAQVMGICTGGEARPVLRVCGGEHGAALNRIFVSLFAEEEGADLAQRRASASGAEEGRPR